MWSFTQEMSILNQSKLWQVKSSLSFLLECSWPTSLTLRATLEGKGAMNFAEIHKWHPTSHQSAASTMLLFWDEEMKSGNLLRAKVFLENMELPQNWAGVKLLWAYRCLQYDKCLLYHHSHLWNQFLHRPTIDTDVAVVRQQNANAAPWEQRSSCFHHSFPIWFSSVRQGKHLPLSNKNLLSLSISIWNN